MCIATWHTIVYTSIYSVKEKKEEAFQIKEMLENGCCVRVQVNAILNM